MPVVSLRTDAIVEVIASPQPAASNGNVEGPDTVPHARMPSNAMTAFVSSALAHNVLAAGMRLSIPLHALRDVDANAVLALAAPLPMRTHPAMPRLQLLVPAHMLSRERMPAPFRALRDGGVPIVAHQLLAYTADALQTLASRGVAALHITVPELAFVTRHHGVAALSVFERAQRAGLRIAIVEIANRVQLQHVRAWHAEEASGGAVHAPWTVEQAIHYTLGRRTMPSVRRELT